MKKRKKIKKNQKCNVEDEEEDDDEEEDKSIRKCINVYLNRELFFKIGKLQERETGTEKAEKSKVRQQQRKI